MTTAPLPDHARQALAALATPTLRKSVAAMVRRRVPAADVEDVAQTVLCDALAAPGIPSDPEELRRFVAGIARHKVADFHRRNRWIDMSAVPEPVAPPGPAEARTLLSRIASSVEGSARERETLEWLVREHAGEALTTIAADVGLPGPAVRQRVSRLRRALRARWAQVLALLVLAGSCGALANRARRAESAGSSIVADPTGDPVAEAVLLAQGTWKLEGLVLDRGAGSQLPALDALDALEASTVAVHVVGRRVEIVLPMHTLTRSIASATARPDGSIAVELRDEAGVAQHVTVQLDGDRMRLVAHDGRVQGRAALVRR